MNTKTIWLIVGALAAYLIVRASNTPAGATEKKEAAGGH